MAKESKRTRNPTVNPANYLSWDASVQRMSPLPRQNATVMAPTLPVEIAPDWTISENSYAQKPTQPMTPMPPRNPNPSGDSPILLDAPIMQALVKQIKVGKRVGGDIYFHRDAISTLAPQMQSMLSSLIQQYAPNTPFDILKISPKALTLSLLSSPSFFESSYPTVQASQTISFKQAPPTSTMARYDERTSPPIYHRTETFLPPQHPRYAELAGRTKRAEELGLYQGEMQKLGNQAAWDEWLAEQGFSEKDGSIVPLEETYQPPLRRFSSSQPSSGVVMPGRERLPELPPGYSIEQELEKIEYAKSTSRKGKLADQALVPRVVAQMVPVGARILDFGAGKYQIHANKLRDMGHDVTAHDFSDVNPDALNRQYDVVYASNVLNVQGSPTMLAYTLQQIHSLVKPGGVFIGNFPADPRPNPYNAQRLLQAISTYFGRPVQIIGGLVPQFGGSGKPSPVSKANAPVFIVQKRDDGNREKNPSAESDARLHREIAAAMGRNPNPKSGRDKALKATGTQKRRIPNAKPRGRTVVAERKNKRRIPNAELSPTQLNSVLGLPPDTRWMSLDTNLRGRRWKQILPSNEMINVYPYYSAYFSGEPYGNSQLYPPSETRSSSAYHFIPGLHIAELIETASGQAPPTPSRLPREYVPSGFSAAKLANHPTIRNLQVPFVQFMDSTLQDAGGQIPDFFALEPYNQAIQQILYGRMLELERESKPDDDLARVRTAMYHRDIPALGRLLYDFQAWRTPERDMWIDYITQYARKEGLDMSPRAPRYANPSLRRKRRGKKNSY